MIDIATNVPGKSSRDGDMTSPLQNTLLKATTTGMGGGACVSMLLVLVVATVRVSTTVVFVIVLAIVDSDKSQIGNVLVQKGQSAIATPILMPRVALPAGLVKLQYDFEFLPLTLRKGLTEEFIAIAIAATVGSHGDNGRQVDIVANDVIGSLHKRSKKRSRGSTTIPIPIPVLVIERRRARSPPDDTKDDDDNVNVPSVGR